MNHIYRLVWNTKRHMLMAVAEVGNAQGKEGGKTGAIRVGDESAEPFRGVRKALVAAVAALFPLVSFAQVSYYPDVIAHGESVTLTDSDVPEYEGMRLRNDGQFDVRPTTVDTHLASLSGSGAVLLGTSDLILTNANDSFSGVIRGNGGLSLAGFEVLSGANTFTGATSVAEWSTLTLSGSGAIAASSGLVNNGTFNIAATNNGADVQSLSGSGAVLLGGQTLTLTNASGDFAGVIQGNGGLNVAGGNEVLSGVNTYTGATNVAQWSALELSGSGSIAASSGLVNNGTFDIAGTNKGAEVQSLSGSGAVLLGGQTLTLTNASGEFAGVVQGNGGLNIAGGNEVLSGVNTYTGATNVAQWSALE
ncbi:ESPR-type extended signal peptide-containing protein, partial [Massilia sp.]